MNKAEELDRGLGQSQGGAGNILYNNSDSTEIFSAITNNGNSNFNSDETVGEILYKADNLDVESSR